MKMSENASVKPYQDKKKKTHERYQSLSNEEKKKNKIVVKDKNCFLV